MQGLASIAAPLGRLMLASIFIISGFNKIGGYAGTQQYMESAGVPGILLPAVIALEILGGLAIVIGWQTRIAALLLAGFCVLSALLFHFDFGDRGQMINFMKNMSLAGAFLVLFAVGPGPMAVDRKTAA